jgi:hypothetical protein
MGEDPMAEALRKIFEEQQRAARANKEKMRDNMGGNGMKDGQFQGEDELDKQNRNRPPNPPSP